MILAVILFLLYLVPGVALTPLVFRDLRREEKWCYDRILTLRVLMDMESDEPTHPLRRTYLENELDFPSVRLHQLARLLRHKYVLGMRLLFSWPLVLQIGGQAWWEKQIGRRSRYDRL